MSDTSGTIATPETPAAVEAPPAAAPETPVDYSAHPVWSKAVEAIPEVLRGPLYETIRSTEAETQKAIEKAREETVPAEWRELAAEAKQAGVTVEQLVEAYRGQALLSEQMSTDPDGFIAEITSNVEQLIASGQLTRKQGAEAIRGAQAAAAEQTDDLLSPEAKQLRELQAWKEQQEQKEAARAQAERDAQAAAAQEAQLEREAEAFFDEFDTQMIAAGLAQRGDDGRVAATIAPETLQLIGETAANLIDRTPGLTSAQAIRQAHQHIKAQVEASGGRLGPAGGAPAATPVIGATATTAAPGAAAANGQPRTMADREAAALAEVLRLRGDE